jgi:hypothetical protein
MTSAFRIQSLTLLAGAALAVALAGCSSYAPGAQGAAARGAGQESTAHTPQGETGTPHGHGAPAAAAGAMGYGVAPSPSNVTPEKRMGQESSQHTPQGETGSPHNH